MNNEIFSGIVEERRKVFSPMRVNSQWKFKREAEVLDELETRCKDLEMRITTLQSSFNDMVVGHCALKMAFERLLQDPKSLEEIWQPVDNCFRQMCSVKYEC